jgi:NAD-dependent DNA ligase
MNLDNQARKSYKESTSSVIYFIVLASYLYYIRDESALSDEVFDKLCKLVIDKNIKHKLLSHLITDDRMRAGSLFDVKANQYPVFIVRDAETLIRNNIWYGEKL